MLSTLNIAKAERVPVNTHPMLLRFSVTAKSKIVNQTDHGFTLPIIEIFHDRQTGIKVGDYLQIEKRTTSRTEKGVTNSSLDQFKFDSKPSIVSFLRSVK